MPQFARVLKMRFADDVSVLAKGFALRPSFETERLISSPLSGFREEFRGETVSIISGRALSRKYRLVRTCEQGANPDLGHLTGVIARLSPPRRKGRGKDPCPPPFLGSKSRCLT